MSKVHAPHPTQHAACGAPSHVRVVTERVFVASVRGYTQHDACKRCAKVLAARDAGRAVFRSENMNHLEAAIAALEEDSPDCQEAGALQIRKYVAALEADAQALADVRTLDDWASAVKGRGHETRSTGIPEYPNACALFEPGSGEIDDVRGYGATPDEARAAAAAWARERARDATCPRCGLLPGIASDRCAANGAAPTNFEIELCAERTEARRDSLTSKSI